MCVSLTRCHSTGQTEDSRNKNSLFIAPVYFPLYLTYFCSPIKVSVNLLLVLFPELFIVELLPNVVIFNRCDNR